MGFLHLNIPDHWNQYYTKYPEGYTILESLLNWVQQVNDMVDNQNSLNTTWTDWETANNKTISDFTAQFDTDLQSTVESTLTDWQNNGFLDVVINDALQTQINSINSKMEQKANLSDIQNIGNSSPKGVYASLAALQSAFPTGTTGIYVVQADGNWYYWNGSAWTSGGTYQATQIGDNTITMNMVAYIQKSKNLFDKAKAISGSYIDSGTGGIIASSGFYYSDYIPVKPNTSYVKKGTYSFAWYDANKVFISGGNQTTALTAPANAYYLRISTYYQDNNGITGINGEQVELGTVSTAYTAYGNIMQNVQADPTIFQKQLNASKIDIQYANRLVKSKNLFNKDTATAGAYINSSGAIVTSSGFYYSDYIPVQPSTSYYKKGTYQYAWYDQNKTYISGGSGNALTSPSNAYYVRISTYATVNAGTPSINGEQLEVGTAGTDYVPYYDTISGLKDSLFTQNYLLLTLPPKIYGVVGKELNIYFDNIMNDRDTDYHFDVACTIGQQYANYYRVTPTTAGSYVFTLTVYKGNTVVAEAFSTIIVSAATVGNGVNKKLLIIGDSTTDNTMFVPHVLDAFSTDVMKVTTVGKRGTSPANHEGHSGWRTTDFVSSGSPFYFNNQFDYGSYVTGNSYGGINHVIIHLGINDIFWFLDDTSLNNAIPSIIANLNTMINSIRSYDANVKIGIGITIPPNYSQDAFGKPYNNDQSRKRYKRNHFLFTKSLISSFSGQEASNIYLVPLNLNLDTRNGFGTSQQQISAHNQNLITFPDNNKDGQTPGVHPADSGYYQMADSLLFFLKSFES